MIDICAGLKQVCCKTMSEFMRGYRFRVKPGNYYIFLDDILSGPGGNAPVVYGDKQSLGLGIKEVSNLKPLVN